jgi:hypothetical protein
MFNRIPQPQAIFQLVESLKRVKKTRPAKRSCAPRLIYAVCPQNAAVPKRNTMNDTRDAAAYAKFKEQMILVKSIVF